MAETLQLPSVQSLMGHGAWGHGSLTTVAAAAVPHPHDDSATQRGPLAWDERAAYLSEGHLYLCITIKVKLGDSFAVFQNLHWCQLFGLSLLSRRKKLRKEKGGEGEWKREESREMKGGNETQVK